jgi:hypothetical protein
MMIIPFLLVLLIASRKEDQPGAVSNVIMDQEGQL